MTRQQRCAEMGHPGTTYNPWSDTTWCACGWAVYPGVGPDAHKHLACCGGPLDIPVGDSDYRAPLPGQEPMFS